MTDHVAVGVAIAAVGVSILFGVVSHRVAREATATARRANALAEAANAMQFDEWSQSYFEPTRQWGFEVVQVMSDGIALRYVADDANRAREWRRVRATLSSLIDTGRLDFPNQLHPTHGIDKPPAFRGYRRDILDWIVFTYDRLDDVPAHDPTKADPAERARQADLVRYKREFISALQAQLNPSLRKERIEEIMVWFADADRSAKLKPRIRPQR